MNCAYHRAVGAPPWEQGGHRSHGLIDDSYAHVHSGIIQHVKRVRPHFTLRPKAMRNDGREESLCSQVSKYLQAVVVVAMALSISYKRATDKREDNHSPLA